MPDEIEIFGIKCKKTPDPIWSSKSFWKGNDGKFCLTIYKQKVWEDLFSITLYTRVEHRVEQLCFYGKTFEEAKENMEYAFKAMRSFSGRVI